MEGEAVRDLSRIRVGVVVVKYRPRRCNHTPLIGTGLGCVCWNFSVLHFFEDALFYEI